MRFITLLILFTICIQNAFSSEFFDNVKEDAISPFNTEARGVLIIGSSLTLLTLILKKPFKDDLQNDVSEDRPLKKYSKVGDFLGHCVPNIAYAAAMSGMYLFSKDQGELDKAILMAKATIYSGIMTDVTKRIVRETRPNGGAFSFPSGHTTTAFAFASVVSMEHSMAWGIAANTMAAFVGFSRMNDNAHYLHDVLAGATIGTMYGMGVYYAQKNREDKKSASAFMLLPLKDGLTANYSFLY